MLLRRDAYAFDMDAVLDAAARNKGVSARGCMY